MNPLIELIAPEPKHAKHWHVWRNQPLSKLYNPMLDQTPDQLSERLSRSQPDLSAGAQQEFRWIVHYSGEPIGTVSLNEVSYRQKHGAIGYHLDERFHQRGFGRIAVSMLIERIFAGTDLHRLIATISAPNIASIKLIEAVGFRREGLLREHFLIGGSYVDVFSYGLLRGEETTHQR
ncbi:GNAT family N-acetyltransferase [Tsuneonella dongtanensis]|nr:GNAT family protein [Tsuneonella dongtanensis]